MSIKIKRNYYQVLGIASNAADAEIKKAYRRLAFQYHPDYNHNADAEEKFKEVTEAYEVLINHEKRAVYDAQQAQFAQATYRPHKQPAPVKVNQEKRSETFIRVIFDKTSPPWAKVLSGVCLVLDSYLEAKRGS